MKHKKLLILFLSVLGLFVLSVAVNAQERQTFSKEDVDEKFRSQVADVIGAANCEKLLQALYNISTLEDISELPALFVAETGPH